MGILTNKTEVSVSTDLLILACKFNRPDITHIIFNAENEELEYYTEDELIYVVDYLSEKVR